MFFLFKPFSWIIKGAKLVFGSTVYKGVTVMKNMLIAQLVGVLLNMFTPELMKKFVDTLLDFVEKSVKGTASPLDDTIVIPICDAIRKTFDIPDND